MAYACVEHEEFFDALEEFSSESSSCSDSSCSEGCTSEIQVQLVSNNAFSSLQYDFWGGNPKSIDERRDDFIRNTGFAYACVEDEFFDALEVFSSESSSYSDSACSEGCTSEIEVQPVSNNAFSSLQYDFWSGNPKSIDERRDDFIRNTGFVLDRCQTAREGPDDTSCVITKSNACDKGKGLACWNQEAVNDEDQEVLYKFWCLKDRKEFEIEADDGMPRNLHEVGLCSYNTNEEFQEAYGSSDSLVQHILASESSEGCDNVCTKICKEDCLKKLSFKAASMFKKDKDKKGESNNRELFGSRSKRIRVHSNKKLSKQLSSLYHMQEFQAHKGSILSMKFSFDGQYLASGGEDGALNVWKIVEEEWITDFDHLNFSVASGNLKFTVNGIPKLACFLKLKEEGNEMNKLKKPSDSAGNGIMVPRKVFRILEKPWHEFHGHEGEILDISWSKNGHLLSSSVDKTVRLWKVGYSRCLKVFFHNDYVTCAQFNPTNDNYFISGSIDGKVRIWDILRCQVVDWIDIKEIVTAVCYRPNGKGGIIGSVVGNCSFFEIADKFFNRVSVMYLQDKKKITCKRITGFQFSPSNPSEVLVSSNDSLVRILKGTNIICKLRGSVPIIDRGSKVFASFTADGKHIISATDDSNTFIWSRISKEKTTNSKPKNIWSSESFPTTNALIAVPWQGIKSNSAISTSTRQPITPRHNQESCISSDNYCSKKSGVGSSKAISPTIKDIDYEFLRDVCASILSGSHMWGLVIVTGGKDGHIRTYHNYGLPIPCPAKSLKSSFSLSNIRNRCIKNCSRNRCIKNCSSLGNSSSCNR